jgi:hypothetical protein
MEGEEYRRGVSRKDSSAILNMLRAKGSMLERKR